MLSVEPMEKTRLAVLHISLTGDAREWLTNEPQSSDYWKKGDDEEIFSDLEETYEVDEDEIAKIFRIKNLLTDDILVFKTYDEFKNEWNKGIPWIPEEPWSEHGTPTDKVHH
ncbi:hypothetical protein Tco_0220549, partial [Tanacetum coccineum]